MKSILYMVFFFILIIIVGCEKKEQGDSIYKVGNRGPAGGWIFYDKGNYSDGWRYLEAAPEDCGSAAFGCVDKIVLAAHKTAKGTGRSNTAVINNECIETKTATRMAASYRGGGMKDWFLPSQDELKELFIGLQQRGIGNFTPFAYWSSSEDKDGLGIYVHFAEGVTSSWSKDYELQVRAIRAF